MAWNQQQHSSRFPNIYDNSSENCCVPKVSSTDSYYLPEMRTSSVHGAADRLLTPNCSEQSTISSQGADVEVLDQNAEYSELVSKEPSYGDPDSIAYTDNCPGQSSGYSRGVDFKTLSQNNTYLCLPSTERILEDLASVAYSTYGTNPPLDCTTSVQVFGGAYPRKSPITTRG